MSRSGDEAAPAEAGIRPFSTAWRTALVAGTLGMIAGLVEGGIVLQRAPWVGVPSRFPLFALLAYGGVFALAGVLAGLALGMLPTRREEAVYRRPIAIGLSLVVFVVGAITVTSTILPGFTAPISLVFDFVFLAVSVLLGLAVYRFAPPFRSATPWLVLGLIALLGGGLIAELRGTSGGSLHSVATPAPELPNILFILADTLRADHLTPYGYPHDTSPWLSDLAAQGVLFENATATASHTKPSTASIFTARYPPAHLARRLNEALPETSGSFIESLRAAGYRTAAFSANGFVSRSFGFGAGFEHFEDRNPPYTALLNLPRAVKRAGSILGGGPQHGWRDHAGNRRSRGLALPADVLLLGFGKLESIVLSSQPPIRPSVGEITRSISTWLEDESPDPFFIYAHVIEPHTPYDPPPDLLRRYEEIHQGRTDRVEYPDYTKGVWPFEEVPGLDESERRGLLARYDAEIADMDSGLRDLAGEVSRHINDRDLLVIFATDHGEEFFEHRGWGHASSLFREVLHVPLILAGLPSLPPGLRIERPVSLVDLAPTVLDLVGLPGTPTFQGVSLAPLLSSPSDATTAVEPTLSPIFSEIYLQDGTYTRALRQGRYKLIEATLDGESEHFFYDLETDPEEQTSLVANGLENTALEMAVEMQTLLDTSTDMAVISRDIELNQEITDQLRALGYVD